MGLVREHFTGGLQDLVDQAIALKGREGQDLGGQEQHKADNCSGFDGTSRRLVGRTFGVVCQSRLGILARA